MFCYTDERSHDVVLHSGSWLWRSVMFLLWRVEGRASFDLSTLFEIASVLTVWLVLGNNYSITNESRTKSARIFFSQGCVLLEEDESE